MDPKPVSTRDLADPLTRPDLPSSTVAAHPLPTLGETVVHDGRLCPDCSGPKCPDCGMPLIDHEDHRP